MCLPCHLLSPSGDGRCCLDALRYAINIRTVCDDPRKVTTPVPWAVLPQPILLVSTSTVLLRVHDCVAGKEMCKKQLLVWSLKCSATGQGLSGCRVWFIITGNAHWKLDSALKGCKPWKMNKLLGRHTPKSVLGKREVAFLERGLLQKATRQRPLFHP